MPSVSWRSPNTLKPTEALHLQEAETGSSATKVDPPKDVIECLFKGHITDIDWLGKLACTFKSSRGQRPGPAFHDQDKNQDKNHIIPLESEVWLTDGLSSSILWRTPFEDCDHLEVGSQSLVSLLKLPHQALSQTFMCQQRHSNNIQRIEKLMVHLSPPPQGPCQQGVV